MNKHNLKVGMVLEGKCIVDFRVVSIGEDGAFLSSITSDGDCLWFTNDEIQDKFNLPKERFLPSYAGEIYWYLDTRLVPDFDTYREEPIDRQRRLVGNMFSSKSEALAKAEEIKKVLMK